MDDLIFFISLMILLKYCVKIASRSSYNAYLLSSEWRRKRLKVLARDLYHCTQCGSSKRLQVHHKTYENLYHEPLEDLITLCASCHKSRHTRKHRLKHIL